ncbi:hypothetical protein F4780DRAFT_756992 [Xylariomycetidae sp. FL0641]|nr:hypothetical protein F4780DRAFT_756992 [Xylariomycetidae sp. FL0641]
MDKVVRYQEVRETSPRDGANETIISSDNSHERPTSRGPEVQYLGDEIPINRSIESLANILITIFLVLLPIAGLIVWLVYAQPEGGRLGIASAVIGGRLTQVQAKAVDFVSGALIAPFLLVLFNWAWFSTARVTALNEQDSSAVPLTTLVELSHTNCGSFDLFKVWSILSGRTFKLFLFALLVILSGVVKTAFANIIAYEAYSREYPSLSPPLASFVEKGWAFPNTTLVASSLVAEDYNLTDAQLADFGSQAISILTGVSYQNATGKLTDGAYIGMNATKATLDGLASNIVGLEEVPAYRMTIGCEAKTPQTLLFMNTGTTAVQVSASDGKSLYSGQFPGQLDALTNANTMNTSFVTFRSGDRNSFYVINMSNGNATQPCKSANGTALDGPGCDPWTPIDSPYGAMDFKAFNLSASGFKGANSISSAWGMNCSVYRESGTHQLTRQSDLSWTITSSKWAGDKKVVPLMLVDWQAALNFHSPSSQIPGLGGAFYPSSTNMTLGVTDYKAYAESFLYANGAMENAMYEIKNADLSKKATQSAEDDGAQASDTQFQVPCTKTELAYRITYVPVILLVGLLALLLAALVPLLLILRNFGVPSLRSWREVNTLRLVMDSLAVPTSESTVRYIHGASNGELLTVGGDVKVRYVHPPSTPGMMLEVGEGLR